MLEPPRYLAPIDFDSKIFINSIFEYFLISTIEDLFDDYPARTFDEITEVIEKVVNNAAINECSNTYYS